MANATPRDARAGFDLYMTAGGDLLLGDLNARLIEAGYGPVKQRTYDHYRSLLNAGYNHYVSINRFDVARAAIPYENASATGRYDYHRVDLGVSVVFAKGSQLLEAYGRASDVAETGALLSFQEPEVISGLIQMKPQPGNMCSVRYLEEGRSVAARILETDLKSEPALIEIEYTRLVSIVAIGVGSALATVPARFVLVGPEDESQTLDLVSRRLFHFFELIEGTRALVNEFGSSSPDPVYAEPPILRTLQVASPAQVVIDVAQQLHALLPLGVVATLLRALSVVPAARREWQEGTGRKRQNRRAEIETQMREQDLIIKRAETALIQQMLARARHAFETGTLTNEDAEKVLREHVLPPIRNLADAGVTGLSDDDESGSVENESDRTEPSDGSQA